MFSFSALTAAGIVWLACASSALASCDGSCWDRCKICSGRLCPPEPTCLTLCWHGKAFCIAKQAAKKNAPFHGVYCGNGNTDPHYKSPGVDELDDACKAHDKCWDQRGRLSCACDKALSVQALQISLSPSSSADLREKAAAVHSFFLSTPCVPP